MVNAVVLTHFLRPPEFGELGLALVAASLLTVALNAPIGQGALIRLFGAAEDEAPGEVDRVLLPPDAARRSFGSALMFTILAGIGVTTLVSIGLLGVLGPKQAAFGGVTAAAGTLGALWRLLSTVPRLQRRPVLYIALASLRPIAVLSISLPLVASGGGVLGAVTGIALGSALASVAAALVVRSTFSPAFDVNELRTMTRRSRPFLPLISGNWLIQNADLYIVAVFATGTELGQYRLASRLGALGSYGTSAFLSAWGPLELSSLFKKSDQLHGRQALRGALLFQFVLLCIFLILTIAVMADQLVQVAPADYEAAASLLPWLGLAFVTQGLVVALYRAGNFKLRAPVFRRGTFVAGLVYLPLAAGLVSGLGAVGAAVAAIVALSGVAIALILGTNREGNPLGTPVSRLLIATILAAGLYIAAVEFPEGNGAAELAVHLAAPVLFVAVMPLLWPAAYRHSLVPLLRAAISRDSTGIRD